MRTIDELKGVWTGLSQAKSTPALQIWLKELKRLHDDLIIQYYNATGEEAVRCLGVLKGLGMALMLEDIFASQVKAYEANLQSELKSKLKI
jgi:hypothetical protein